MPNFKRFGQKLREEIGFEEFGPFFPISGPWTKITKSGLVLLLGLTQGTCVPNFKRFRRKLKEEIGFEEFANFPGPFAKIAKVGKHFCRDKPREHVCQISKDSDEN